MSTMRSQITGVSIVYATFCSGPEQRKHQSSVSPVTGEFPEQKASNAETVSIWWRHHDFTNRENCNNILVSDDFLNMYSRGVFSWRLRRILKAMCAYLKPFTWCMRQPDGCIFTGLKLENYYFFTFTFSRPEVRKLLLFYVFTFSRPEVRKLFRIYVFTFSRPARPQ